MINFSWPAEYLTFKKEVIKFAESLNEHLIEDDQKGNFSLKAWKKCADFGLQSLSLSQEYGGPFKEVDFLRAMLAMEGFGYGCKDNGLALALNAQMWTVQHPIAHFGSDDLKTKYLPGMASGNLIGCHALTEPDAGSDAYQMQMSAQKTEKGYLLNGHKRHITLGPLADMALIFAKSNPDKGKWGISAFVVESGTNGFTQSNKQHKMGLRTVPIGELKFDDCLISERQLVGKEGMGFSILNHSLEYDRCCILASHIGAMERQLEENIQFVKRRKQYGQSISKFQSVSNRIVDMKLRLETSKLLLYKVAWLKSKGKSAIQETALLKLYISENFVSSSLDAIRNRGGEGYLTEFETERDLRDSIGGILYAGTSDIQRNIVAQMLGL